MIRHSFARLGAVVAACTACAALPASAAAQSDGGLGFGSSTEATPAAGAAGTLVVRTAVYLGKTLRVDGTMAHGLANQPVLIQRQEKSGAWSRVATATTTAGGAFTARWKTDHIGRFPMRAIPRPATGTTVSAAALPATGVTPVTVYRARTATWYGPGFFGKRTACGQILRKSTLGVAHRTLPCGTQVAFYYKGRTVTVPVIDRGPFRDATIWDLTQAAARAIDFKGAETVGALRLPKATAVAAPAG
ncbi:lipoprotein precursor [Paraconexibacter sp. AEG42_29]|uniref:Lipoprotein n=1 Tax=Paraconexibacter sp. AEG42_29 TaxID=2997339 RepID=A0AAU7AZT0_9ACTN